MLNAMDFDVIDFNMGCPMKKVVNRDAGAALLNDPELALTCVQVLRDVVTRPLTIKMRILDADDPAPTVALCQRLHACGVDGIAIHGRIASKIYSGPVAATIIKAVRDSLPASFPITANGGIFSYADAERLRLASGCDRLMIARGAIGNPWLFRDLLAGTPPTPIDHAEICEVMHEHILGMIALYGETGAMILGRKTVLSYLCGRGYRRTLRAQASTIATKADFDALFAAVEKEGPIGLPQGDARLAAFCLGEGEHLNHRPHPKGFFFKTAFAWAPGGLKIIIYLTVFPTLTGFYVVLLLAASRI